MDMVQDTISDLFIRLKNASHARLERVEGIPYGKYQEEILKVLVREGYIKGYEIEEKEGKKYLSVQLKFGPGKQPVLNEVRLISVPSRRIYAKRMTFQR